MENPAGCTYGPYLDGWFNTVCFEAWQLPFFFIGCGLWAVAYAVIIHNSRKFQFIEMPAIAAAANIAWETVWAFIHTTNMGSMAVFTYRLWWITDIPIFMLLMRYGYKQGWSPTFVRHFRPMFVIATIVWLSFFWLYQSSGYTDHFIGAITAYADNVAISVLYLFQLSRLKDVRGMSPLVAWLKMIGTGLNTIFMILVFRNDYFLWSMGLWIALFDCVYIAWLYQRRREQAAGIPGVPPLDSQEPIAAP